MIERLIAAMEPDDVVLGGGNAVHIGELPPRCRLGANANAFPGGFRLWGDSAGGTKPRHVKPRTAKSRTPKKRPAGKRK